jgi:electron transport complex protein RnfE
MMENLLDPGSGGELVAGGGGLAAVAGFAAGKRLAAEKKPAASDGASTRAESSASDGASTRAGSSARDGAAARSGMAAEKRVANEAGAAPEAGFAAEVRPAADQGLPRLGRFGQFGALASVIKNGLLDENPTFRLILGTCPTLAVTTSAINGVGMGLSAAAVLICSNVVISLIRKLIPDTVRIPAFITIIAGFVTIVDLLLHAFVPSLYSALGIFIPLIVVNCIILARAEMFACKNSVARSAADGLGMGLGFTAALILIGSVRELLGNGTIFGIIVTQSLFTPAALMLLPPGGFLAYGVILGAINKIANRKAANAGCEGCALKCGMAGGGNGGENASGASGGNGGAQGAAAQG